MNTKLETMAALIAAHCHSRERSRSARAAFDDGGVGYAEYRAFINRERAIRNENHGGFMELAFPAPDPRSKQL